MKERRRPPFNPLVLDPNDFDRLYDEDYVSPDELDESDSEYDYLSNGSRRRKPQTSAEF